MMRVAVLAALLAVAAAKDHYDLDGDGVVGIDEFAVVAFAEQGASKGEIGEIVKASDRNGNGVLARDELQQAKNALDRIAKEKGAEWLKENDSNHDGRFSKEEFQKAVMKKVGLGHKDIADMWKMSDKNRDNFISVSEASMALYLVRTKSILEANKMLEKFDSDRNSRLSEDEAILMADVAFDVGTDEALDAFERVAANEEEIGSSLMEGLLETLRESAIGNVEERIREVDTDGDGVVSFAELRRRFRKKKGTLLKKLFRKCDVNRDNVLDGPEWVTLTTEVAMLKKRKTKHDKVIHVHPQTNEAYRGAARDDDDFERRRKRAAEEKRETIEEIIKVSQWDGLLPIRVEPAEPEPEITEKDRVDPKFAKFSDLNVEDDNDELHFLANGRLSN